MTSWPASTAVGSPHQRAVLKFVDALVDSRGLRNGNDDDQEDGGG